jgi:hypothetical protein
MSGATKRCSVCNDYFWPQEVTAVGGVYVCDNCPKPQKKGLTVLRSDYEELEKKHNALRDYIAREGYCPDCFVKVIRPDLREGEYPCNCNLTTKEHRNQWPKQFDRAALESEEKT